MIKKFTLPVLFLMVVLLSYHSAFSNIIAQHLGSNDPEAEGWNTPHDRGAAEIVDGEEVWRMQGTGFNSMDGGFSGLNGGSGPAGGWAAQFRVKMEAANISQPDAITALLRDGGCNDIGPGWDSRANSCSPGDFSFYPWDTLEADGLGNRNEFNNFRVVYDSNDGANGTTTFSMNDHVLGVAPRDGSSMANPPTAGPDGQLVGFGWSGGAHTSGYHDWAYFILADSVAELPNPIGPYGLAGPIVSPNDYVWNSADTASWENSSSWSPKQDAPPGDAATVGFSNNTVLFGPAIGAARTVTSDSAVSVRAITFDNSNTYAIAGTGSVSLIKATAVGAPEMSSIGVLQGSHQFQLNVHLQNSTDIDVSSDAVLEFNNRLFLNNNTLTKTGAGTLAINNNFVTGGGTFNCSEGTCSGTGTISADVINNGGTISPGSDVAANLAVPEPTAWLLLGIGSIGWILSHRRRGRR